MAEGETELREEEELALSEKLGATYREAGLRQLDWQMLLLTLEAAADRIR